MNTIKDKRVYMRSMATRKSNRSLSKSISDTLLIMIPRKDLEDMRQTQDMIILEELDIHYIQKVYEKLYFY